MISKVVIKFNKTKRNFVTLNFKNIKYFKHTDDFNAAYFVFSVARNFYVIKRFTLILKASKRYYRRNISQNLQILYILIIFLNLIKTFL